MNSWTPEQIRAIERQQARRNYERLLLHQPHVPVEGLWEAGGTYVVVSSVPLANLTANDGTPLEAWMKKNREITSRPLFNGGDMADELALRLRGRFPRFAFRTEPPRAIVTVSRNLSVEEHSALGSAFEATQANMTLVVEVATLPPTKRDALALIPSIQMPDAFGREARWFCEADEETWEGLRASLFGPTPPSPNNILPDELRKRRARCVIEATSFQPANIRTVLPLFQKVAINLPLENSMERNLVGLGITEAELLHLAEIGRVEVLLPMSLDRYSPRLISKLVERAPDAVVGPRRLAAAVVAHARDRIPLLYPGVGIKERHAGLRALEEHLSALAPDGHAARAARILVTALRDAWARQEFTVQTRGVWGSAAFGTGPIMAAFIREFAGRDLLLELQHAGQHVEVGAAIGGTIIPVVGDGYSTQAASELCASFYSGAPAESSVLQFAEMKVALDGILGLEDDAPIREVVEVFQGGDVARLRALLVKLTSENQDQEYLREAVEDFNAKVRAFDRSSKNLAKFGLAGTLTALAAYAGVVAVWVPFTVLAAGFLLTGPEYKGVPGWLLDMVRAANARTSADVVLVSRLKRGS